MSGKKFEPGLGHRPPHIQKRTFIREGSGYHHAVGSSAYIRESIGDVMCDDLVQEGKEMAETAQAWETNFEAELHNLLDPGDIDAHILGETTCLGDEKEMKGTERISHILGIIIRMKDSSEIEELDAQIADAQTARNREEILRITKERTKLVVEKADENEKYEEEVRAFTRKLAGIIIRVYDSSDNPELKKIPDTQIGNMLYEALIGGSTEPKDTYDIKMSLKNVKATKVVLDGAIAKSSLLEFMIFPEVAKKIVNGEMIIETLKNGNLLRQWIADPECIGDETYEIVENEYGKIVDTINSILADGTEGETDYDASEKKKLKVAMALKKCVLKQPKAVKVVNTIDGVEFTREVVEYMASWIRAMGGSEKEKGEFMRARASRAFRHRRNPFTKNQP